MGWDGPMTHRQWKAWVEWLDQQWNQPSRSDHYLMKIAWRCTQAVVKHPNASTEAQQRIQFTKKDSKGSTATTEGSTIKEVSPSSVAVQSAVAKASWYSRLGPPMSKTPPYSVSLAAAIPTQEIPSGGASG